MHAVNWDGLLEMNGRFTRMVPLHFLYCCLLCNTTVCVLDSPILSQESLVPKLDSMQIDTYRDRSEHVLGIGDGRITFIFIVH